MGRKEESLPLHQIDLDLNIISAIFVHCLLPPPPQPVLISYNFKLAVAQMVHKICNTRMALTVPSDTLQEDAIQFGLPSYTKHNDCDTHAYLYIRLN